MARLKDEIARLTSELAATKRLLRQTFPTGDPRRPDRLWTLIRQLSDHTRTLADLADPYPTTTNGDTPRGADTPVFPGVGLSNTPGDRNLYHAGRRYDRELVRLVDDLAWILRRSQNRIDGLDLEPARPHHRRPTCPTCTERVGVSWRWCPWCQTPLTPE